MHYHNCNSVCVSLYTQTLNVPKAHNSFQTSLSIIQYWWIFFHYTAEISALAASNCLVYYMVAQ